MLLFVFYKIKLRCDSALDHLSLDYYNRCFDLNAVTTNGAAAGSGLSECKKCLQFTDLQFNLRTSTTHVHSVIYR